MSSLLLLLVALLLLLLVVLVAADTSLGKQHFLAEPADKVATRGERVSACFIKCEYLGICAKNEESGSPLWSTTRYTREMLVMQIYLYFLCFQCTFMNLENWTSVGYFDTVCFLAEWW